ncbi:precorrin-2 C(20)-methyltransferase [Aureivirga sp. CE67]|uniref:precorrin-2 C(20)-methyltransferase n=1 Tax=Aureivirga sp. CE67 TaxID=1788983 RepID=UPI0018CB641B|nr:precorrin-2 C(20)-methyltransferase [Aureivirga sp. CE67]
MLHPVVGVSVGPGDPELITVKALKALENADIIYFTGSEHKGIRKSYVLPILEFHQISKEKCKGFFIPMDFKRDGAKKTYLETVEAVQKDYLDGKKVCVICEGDISLFASFSYMMEHFHQREIPISLIPGVNAFSLNAAEQQVPISLLKEKVAILPRVQDISEIDAYMENFDTLILMKIKSGWNTFQKELEARKYQCFYGEKLGTSEMFFTKNIKDLKNREIPYFSLLMLKK